MKKTIATVILLLVVLSRVFAQAEIEKNSLSSYVASTSWTASFASLAGLGHVPSIAPASMKHPPEYEITANDIKKVVEAKLFIYAGYEGMMKTIAKAAGVKEENLVKVKTQNSLEVIESQVLAIAEKAGTMDKAKDNLEKLEKLFEETKLYIKQNNIDSLPCYVNVNQEPLAKSLGLNVVGTFGPAPVTSDQILLVSQEKYPLIIDNVHNPVAGPLASVSEDSRIIVWRNFPETTEENSLYLVLKDNFMQL